MQKLSVIYENEDILVVDKPHGVVVHPFDFSTEETLLDQILAHTQTSIDTGNTITLQDGRTVNLSGIVHKLDRETSGVLVYAKNKATHEILSLQFRNHEVKKTYTALVSGIVQEDTLTIDAPLGRNKKSNKQVVNPENPRGELRSAVTHLTVLTRNKDTTVVTLSPKTGRTHQLRAHMAHIGHPIVGDGMYGTKENSTRLMLHATALSFTLHGELKEFSSPALF